MGNTPAVEAETKRGETKQEITIRVSGVHLKPGDFKTFDASPRVLTDAAATKADKGKDIPKQELQIDMGAAHGSPLGGRPFAISRGSLSADRPAELLEENGSGGFFRP